MRLTAPPCALALIALPMGAAIAETPQGLWQSWQAAARATDARLTAREIATARGLGLQNLTLQAGDGLTLRLERVDLDDAGAGMVAIRVPDTAELIVDPPDAGSGGSDLMVFRLGLPGFSASVGAVGDAYAVSMKAPSLSLVLDRIEPPLPPDESVEIALAGADLAFDWSQGLRGALEVADSRLTIATLHFDLDAVLGDPSKGTVTVDLSGVDAHLSGAIPTDLRDRDPGQELGQLVAALAGGLSIDIGVKVAQASAALNVVQGSAAPVALDAGFSGGEVGFGLDRTAMTYLGALGAGSLRVQGVEQGSGPEDLGLAWARLHSDFTLGLNDLWGPEPWSCALRAEGVTLNDAAWAGFDPGAALIRAPMSLVLAFSGIYEIDPALLAPGSVVLPDDDIPLVDLSLNLDEVLFDALGLRLTATGGLEFDFSNMLTFTDGPAPDGRLEFAATGVNALIGGLVKAGLVSAEEESSMRLGLMFIAKPGAAPDSLQTLIEFREGAFYLNGVFLP